MIRWFLYMHDSMKSTFYVVNGMVFTLSFFLVRNCLQTFMVVKCLIPAMIWRMPLMESDDKLEIIVSLATFFIYLILCFMNVFWFYKLVVLLIRTFVVKKEGSEDAYSKESN